MSSTPGGWVKVGTDTTWVLIAVGVGLAALGGAALGVPVGQLVGLTSGTPLEWWPSALWTFMVLAVLICVPLAIFANRPALINAGAGLLRVAWRTVSFGELSHVYRMPGGHERQRVRHPARAEGWARCEAADIEYGVTQPDGRRVAGAARHAGAGTDRAEPEVSDAVADRGGTRRSQLCRPHRR